MMPAIRDVAVIGSGLAALVAALSIARRIPGVRIIHLDPALPPDPIDDLVGASRPSIRAFHRAIGVDESEIVLRTGSGFRLGTSIDGIAAEAFFRGHGRFLSPAGATPHQLLAVQAPLDRLSPAASLAAQSRFAPPMDDPLPPFAGLDPGLQLALHGYGQALTALGRAAGVVLRRDGLVAVEQAPDTGSISALRLASGEHLTADLYVDATGTAARVRSTLPATWIDWSRTLPIDRLSIRQDATPEGLAPEDRIGGHANGWEYRTRAPASTSTIRAWSSRFGDAPGEDGFAITQGRLAAPFSGNVVAIGAAAVALEPLAATGLHLVVRQVERLVSLWPERIPTPTEADLFNRRTAMEADRALDFVQLHYRLAARPEPFWRAAANPDLSEAMALDLALFGERGRLTPHDEDGFERDEWLQLLIGLGVRPRRRDALAFETLPAGLGAAVASARADLERAVRAAPTQSWWLGKLAEATS